MHTVSEVTERASQSGYRLIDTAWCYGMLKMQRIVLLPYQYQVRKRQLEKPSRSQAFHATRYGSQLNCSTEEAETLFGHIP